MSQARQILPPVDASFNPTDTQNLNWLLLPSPGAISSPASFKQNPKLSNFACSLSLSQPFPLLLTPCALAAWDIFTKHFPMTKAKAQPGLARTQSLPDPHVSSHPPIPT